MRFRRLLINRWLWLIFVVVLGAGVSEIGSASEAQDLAALLKTADELYATRSDPANLQKSIDILNKLLASVSDTNTNTNTGTDSSTYEALWRLARAYRWEAE
ncbi:MAG: hypothetical protein ACM3TT_05170, partial [Syntrophothermus sp.]